MKMIFRRNRICPKCFGRRKTDILVLRIIGSGENYSVCSGGFVCDRCRGTGRLWSLALWRR